MSRTHRSTLVLALAISLAGCGDPAATPDSGAPDAGSPQDSGSGDDASVADAGTDSGSVDEDAGIDGGPADAGPGACDGAREITFEADGTASVNGTTAGLSSPLSLGCGIDPAPQEILSLTVPGTGTVSVSILLSGVGLADPLFEVRRSCDDADAICVTDDSRFAAQAYGAFLAEGGETLLVAVSGDRASDVGDWSMSISTATGVETACEATTDVAIEPGVESVITVRPNPSIDADGVVYSSCSPPHLEEALLQVEIPAAGRYDLVATTQRDANATSLDTYLYAQTTCGDPRSELLCADDIDDDDVRSVLELREVAPGSVLTIGVEVAGIPADVEVALRLVEVLEIGQSCARDGFSRCATGECNGRPLVCTAP